MNVADPALDLHKARSRHSCQQGTVDELKARPLKCGSDL